MKPIELKKKMKKVKKAKKTKKMKKTKNTKKMKKMKKAKKAKKTKKVKKVEKVKGGFNIVMTGQFRALGMFFFWLVLIPHHVTWKDGDQSICRMWAELKHHQGKAVARTISLSGCL